MKKTFYLATILLWLTSCDTENIEPKVDKLVLLSGDLSTGKQWRLTSFKTTSNYFTFDVNKFQTTESWQDYPESIKDNTTIIFPNGEVQVDEGKVRYNDESPQLYVERQFWILNERQDSVKIEDYVGLPSIHSTWGLAVTDDKIILTRQENDIGFKGSKLTQTVTFCSFD